MRKIGMSLVGLLSLTLVGCGSPKETIRFNLDHFAAYAVVSSDSQAGLDAINVKEVSVKSGDEHVGSTVCTGAFTYSGHSYTLSIYVDGALDSLTQQLLSGACNSGAVLSWNTQTPSTSPAPTFEPIPSFSP
jgi:hypothetical protein